MALSRRTRRVVSAVWFLMLGGLFLSRCLTHWAPSLQGYRDGVFGQVGTSPQESEPAWGDVAEWQPSEGLRLGTWNLRWLMLPGRGPEPRTRSELSQLRRAASALDVDVLAVQEVGSVQALGQIFPSEHFAYHLAQHGNQRSGFVVRRGVPFRAQPDLDALALGHLRAGAQIEVGWGQRSLSLLSLHLKARCKGRQLGPSEACRKLAAQVPVLETWIDDHARRGEAFVVLGDFNRFLLPDGPLWRELDDGDPPGLALSAPSVALRNTCLDGRHRHLIDHVLLGGPATAWLAPGSARVVAHRDPRALGDHCPVLLQLGRPASE